MTSFATEAGPWALATPSVTGALPRLNMLDTNRREIEYEAAHCHGQ